MPQSNLAVEFDFQFPAKPAPLSDNERKQYKDRIKLLLKDSLNRVCFNLPFILLVDRLIYCIGYVEK